MNVSHQLVRYFRLIQKYHRLLPANRKKYFDLFIGQAHKLEPDPYTKRLLGLFYYKEKQKHVDSSEKSG